MDEMGLHRDNSGFSGRGPAFPRVSEQELVPLHVAACFVPHGAEPRVMSVRGATPRRGSEGEPVLTGTAAPTRPGGGGRQGQCRQSARWSAVQGDPSAEAAATARQRGHGDIPATVRPQPLPDLGGPRTAPRFRLETRPKCTNPVTGSLGSLNGSFLAGVI